MIYSFSFIYLNDFYLFLDRFLSLPINRGSRSLGNEFSFSFGIALVLKIGDYNCFSFLHQLKKTVFFSYFILIVMHKYV